MIRKMAATGVALSSSKFRVELHCHLDGSVRCSTLYDLAKKNDSPEAKKPYEEFMKDVTYLGIGNLQKFLKVFDVFTPWIVGDKEAIERIAYELCEDKAKNGVTYIEARYSPHLLANDNIVELGRTGGDVSPRDVVMYVNEGLRKGSKDFGITVKSILCCMRGFPGWSHDVVELCKEFHNDTVVAIDLAGDEDICPSKEDIDAFLEAESCGIHRTVHAGESGPAANVKEALDVMKAERIGHGYHVLSDEKLYQRVIDERIHLEVCPMSSYHLGTAGTTDFKKHPAVRFAADNVNFSLNTDDDSVFQTTITNEYNVAFNKMGLSEAELSKITFNAARSAFLPDDKKQQLLQHLKVAFGVIPKPDDANGQPWYCNTL
ncbi:adenosine deaminase-like [Glandiceps talaboti]